MARPYQKKNKKLLCHTYLLFPIISYVCNSSYVCNKSSALFSFSQIQNLFYGKKITLPLRVQNLFSHNCYFISKEAISAFTIQTMWASSRLQYSAVWLFTEIMQMWPPILGSYRQMQVGTAEGGE